jgi:hypothetical protein
MSLPNFTEDSLELLVIAAMSLKLLDGRLTNVDLDRVLSAEICAQLPSGVLTPHHVISRLRATV